ncbi:hypothetical protein OP10G_3195 [Fimbriimonas ginsengisoli Gsoil 348]|uniref:Acetyltransferase n=1 Tax=Fimbriimonas ginsengisoli Gsoil 348 TaxID=661478 RepID=A0A068NST1_FIMGI|nr:hypothetical protein OP10G_3195 [Fimbriimonas ginsengisoli Gsoil 348]
MIAKAGETFQELVLYTSDAGPFYDRLGFEHSGVENPSHRMRLPAQTAGG